MFGRVCTRAEFGREGDLYCGGEFGRAGGLTCGGGAGSFTGEGSFTCDGELVANGEKALGGDGPGDVLARRPSAPLACARARRSCASLCAIECSSAPCDGNAPVCLPLVDASGDSRPLLPLPPPPPPPPLPLVLSFLSSARIRALSSQSVAHPLLL